MVRPPAPGSFEHLVVPVNVPVEKMWRLSQFPETEPFFALHGQYRFDDPEGLLTGATFGVLYVAELPETAFCESILHDVGQFVNGAHEVASAKLQGRSLVGFGHPTRTHLTLADMTGAALVALGLDNNFSAGDSYTQTQAWAQAIHALPDNFDGIRYVSRRNNREVCYAVFDRSGIVAGSSQALSPVQVAQLCRVFNVRPV